MNKEQQLWFCAGWLVAIILLMPTLISSSSTFLVLAGMGFIGAWAYWTTKNILIPYFNNEEKNNDE